MSVAILALCAVPAAAQTPPLTVERVASLPSLIGTAPAAPVWSPDGTRIAFLWNDQGWPLRDVWVVARDGSGRRRVTAMADTDPAPAPPADDSTEALGARAAARARGGVSEVLWDGPTALLVVHRGTLFRYDLSGADAPERLGVGGDVSDVALSPDGTRLAFLREGDLWLWTRGAAGVAPVKLTDIGVSGIGTAGTGA